MSSYVIGYGMVPHSWTSFVVWRGEFAPWSLSSAVSGMLLHGVSFDEKSRLHGEAYADLWPPFQQW